MLICDLIAMTHSGDQFLGARTDDVHPKYTVGHPELQNILTNPSVSPIHCARAPAKRINGRFVSMPRLLSSSSVFPTDATSGDV